MSFVRALRFDAIFRDLYGIHQLSPLDEHHLYRAFQSTHLVFAAGGENAAIISGILQEFSPIESAHRVYLVISLISLLIVESLPVTAPAIRYCDPINFALIITQRLCVCSFFIWLHSHHEAIRIAWMFFAVSLPLLSQYHRKYEHSSYANVHRLSTYEGIRSNWRANQRFKTRVEQRRTTHHTNRCVIQPSSGDVAQASQMRSWWWSDFECCLPATADTQ